MLWDTAHLMQSHFAAGGAECQRAEICIGVTRKCCLAPRNSLCHALNPDRVGLGDCSGDLHTLPGRGRLAERPLKL